MGWDGPMTERQWAAWQAWLEEEWNVPDRGDHYLMQCAAVSAIAGGDKDATTDKFRMKFKIEERRTTDDQATKRRQDQQLAELKEQGWSVPRRMTKEDIALAQARIMAGMTAVRPKPPDPRRKTK